jgi:hypothetical protein
MRTYRKHAALSMISSSPHLSLPIPCQGPWQGKGFPCHCPRNYAQAIDFAELNSVNRKKFPVISLSAGKIAISSLRQLGDTIGWHAPGESEHGLVGE